MSISIKILTENLIEEVQNCQQRIFIQLHISIIIYHNAFFGNRKFNDQCNACMGERDQNRNTVGQMKRHGATYE